MNTAKLNPIDIGTPFGDVRIKSRYRKSKGTYSLLFRGCTQSLRHVFPHRIFQISDKKISTELTDGQLPIRTIKELKEFQKAFLVAYNDRECNRSSEQLQSISTLGQLTQHFLLHQNHLAASTLENYTGALKSWSDLLGEDLLLSEVSPSNLRIARDKLKTITVKPKKKTGKTRSRSSRSVNNYLRVLKTMLNFAYSEDICENRSHEKVKFLIEEPVVIQWWNADEVKQALQTAHTISVDAYLCVVLGIYTGMRRGEIDRLKWEDISYDDDQWVVTVNKAKSLPFRRYIPVCTELRKILEKHNATRSTGYVIRPARKTKGDKNKYRYDMKKLIQKIVEKSKVKRITMHGMRHTFASLMLHQGAPVFKVSRWLGHATTKTTERVYAHMTIKDDDINLLSFE